MEWILQLLFNFLILDFYFLLIFCVPGWLLVRRLKLAFLDSLVFSAVLGFGTVSAIIYILRGLGLPFWLIEAPFLITSLWTIRQLSWSRLKRIKFSNIQVIIGIVFFLISLVHGSVLIQSALPTQEGKQFVSLSFHDSMQHISFIRRLHDSGQVNHPGFAGAELTNYHYLIDSTLAAMTRFDFVSLDHAYYRYYPILISLIFSLTLFVVFRRLVKHELLAGYGVVFTLFAGNASYFVSYFRGPEYSWGSNAFIINPIIDILQNPASIFVLAQFLFVLLLLKFFTSRKTISGSKTLLLIMGLIAGTMIGFKAWGGIIVMIGLVAAAGWETVIKRSFRLWPVVILAGIISAMLFFPGYQPQTSASPVWAPGWTLESLVMDADRWNYIPDYYQKDTFIFQENYFGVFKIYTKWTIIYVVGNYWVRFIGLVAIFALIIKLRRWTGFEAAVVSTTGASLVIPLLFNQGKMAYDIEQFSPYALLLASVATVVVINWVRLKLGSKITFWSLAILLLLISIPSNYTSLKARLLPHTFVVTPAELDLYQEVESATDPDSVILLKLSHRNIATLEFSAMTNRDTYYSGRTLSIITGEPFDERADEIQAMFYQDSFNRNKYIRDNQIDYLFLYADEELEFMSMLDLDIVHQNSAGTLYSL